MRAIACHSFTVTNPSQSDKANPAEIRIPSDLLPADGRFGSGPSKVPADAVQALADAGATVLGTSHRQPTVKFAPG
jgi:hypothetical protein